MRWLHERGLISSYDDYLGLPYAVLEDCRLLIEHEAAVSRAGAQHGV